MRKAGRKLSTQRHFATDVTVLERCRDEVIEPALKKFQDEHGPVKERHVGNWDESQLDLCDFAERGNYWCLAAFGNRVLTPYEQSPHFTMIIGHMGDMRLAILLVRIGAEYTAPHPYNAQLLQSKWTLFIAQSPTGLSLGRISKAGRACLLDEPDPTYFDRRSAGSPVP